MSAWGLTNVHREYYKFGVGWSSEKSAIRMVLPDPTGPPTPIRTARENFFMVQEIKIRV